MSADEHVSSDVCFLFLKQKKRGRREREGEVETGSKRKREQKRYVKEFPPCGHFLKLGFT